MSKFLGNLDVEDTGESERTLLFCREAFFTRPFLRGIAFPAAKDTVVACSGDL